MLFPLYSSDYGIILFHLFVIYVFAFVFAEYLFPAGRGPISLFLLVIRRAGRRGRGVAGLSVRFFSLLAASAAKEDILESAQYGEAHQKH